MPASDDKGLSRRSLFRFGLDRIAPKEPPSPPPRRVAGEPDAAGQARRWRQARDASDGGRLGRDVGELLLESAAAGMGDRVLDAGAGAGHLTALALDRGAEVVALEPAATLRERGRQTAPGAEWVDGELELAPFREGSFDLALCAFGLSASLGAPAALESLFRVVRPGGTVALATWRPGGIVGRLLRLADAVDPLPEGVHPPATWGREDRMRAEMRNRSAGASYDAATLRLSYESVQEAVDGLCAGLVPLAAALARLPEGDRGGLRAEVARLVGDAAVHEDDRVALEACVLIVAADRP